MRVFHVAIADDWEASLPFGSYEASTHGRSLEDEGFIHATTADGVQHVLDTCYAGMDMPLLLIALDPDALGVAVQWEPQLPPRILGAIPCTNEDAVVSVTPLSRASGRWLAPSDVGPSEGLPSQEQTP
jgi:uncharacterized protein (DUF952 family)